MSIKCDDGIHFDSSDAPCPFCGDTRMTPMATNIAPPETALEEPEYTFRVYCLSCHNGTGDCDSYETAMDAWKMRK